jgi:predicted nucleotidyltransferase
MPTHAPPAPRPSSLEAVFPSTAFARLVIFFLLRPAERVHFRALARQTRLAHAPLSRETERLVRLGALGRKAEAGRVHFSAEPSHAAWRAWGTLLRTAAAPEDVLHEALACEPLLEAAFIFGSAARSDLRAGSDLDLLLVTQDDSDAMPLRRRLSDLEPFLARPLDIVEYTTAELRRALQGNNHFLRRVLAEPRTLLAGTLPDALNVAAA